MAVIHPFIVGHGRAGNAIAQALAILKTQITALEIREPIWVERHSPLAPAADGLSLALISNPHGLHAERIFEADRAGFVAIASEKPACVTREQASKLSRVKAKTAIFHVYRQMWGPQELKKMISEKFFGDLITIEGRYWQASTAERALTGPAPQSWKNNIALSGPSDTLLDVGVHWADLAIFLAESFPSKLSGWSSYANAEAAHRDSHVHLVMDFSSGLRALSSITKNAHGATNHFEVNVFGTKASATWTFLNPDEINLGEGRERRVLTKKSSSTGTGHPPFHGAGWMEGYIEILRQLLFEVSGVQSSTRYPTLRENIQLVDALLSSKILKSSAD